MAENNGLTGLEIAVIGMSGRFPGARNIDEFWENLKNGIESLRFYTDEELLEAGVNVTCGQDDLQNMFYPYGRMDPLEVALITAHAAHLASPDEIRAAFDMPRYRAARMLRLPRYGVEVGAPADLVLLDAASAVEALRRQPPRRAVIRAGRVLAETRVRVDLAEEIAGL